MSPPDWVNVVLGLAVGVGVIHFLSLGLLFKGQKR